MLRTPTAKLVAGLLVAISTLVMIALVALGQIRTLRNLQEDVIDRNRLDSLQLLRIQNSLNALALVSRDMAEETMVGPIPTYRARVDRLIMELTDGLRREQDLAPKSRSPQDFREIMASADRLRDEFQAALRLAEDGDLSGAIAGIRGPVFEQRSSLSARVDELLVRNYEEAERIAGRAAEVHRSTERTIILFVATLILLMVGFGTYSIIDNRRVLRRLEQLSREKGELARQMIGMQESILRTVSRELHDDFGQILTAVNAILARIRRKAGAQLEPSLAEQIGEVHDATRQALERARDLSQTLHPALLESHGLVGALDRFLPGFERQSGIRVHFQGKENFALVPAEKAIHVYRIIQESLTNVSRHAKTSDAWLRTKCVGDSLLLEIEDHGAGILHAEAGHPSRPGSKGSHSGLGIVAMRERTQILGGFFRLETPADGGTRVSIQVPLESELAE